MTTYQQRQRRAARVRSKIAAVSDRPRLHLFRSLRYVSAQVIDDQQGKTLVAVHEKSISGATKKERLEKLGSTIAAKMKEAGITKVVLDRGRYAYHGSIAVVTESVRQAGVEV